MKTKRSQLLCVLAYVIKQVHVLFLVKIQLLKKVLDKLAETMNDVGGIKTIREFTDFDFS